MHRLAAGHRLTWTPGTPGRRGRRDVCAITAFRHSLRPSARPAQDAIAAVRDALRDSVHAHLQSEVPLGAFLSSGIDSTAVVALARERRPGICTCTPSGSTTSATARSRRPGDRRGARRRPTATLVDDADVIAALPRIVWHLDDPVADPAIVPLWFLARTAARDVTVVLSGEGADELFGGYEIYREPAALAGVAAPARRRCAAACAPCRR